jgi:hypothetical protein
VSVSKYTIEIKDHYDFDGFTTTIKVEPSVIKTIVADILFTLQEAVAEEAKKEKERA